MDPRHAAAAALLNADDELQKPGANLDQVISRLREAVDEACYCFLRLHRYNVDRGQHPSAIQNRFFRFAHQSLSERVVLLIRKLNYLATGSPYVSTLQEDWSTDRIDEELHACVDEARLLLQSITGWGELSAFRGQNDVRMSAGARIVFDEFAWGTWKSREGTILRVEMPHVLVRFPEHRVERLDLRIAPLRPSDQEDVDLDNPFEKRRAWFDLFLSRSPGLRPGHVLDRLYGAKTAHYVFTCDCCGFPTHQYERPFDRLLGISSPPLHPHCRLCDWPSDAADDPPQKANENPLTLSDARSAFTHTHSIYSDSSPGDRARVHQLEHLKTEKQYAVSLFNAMVRLDEDDSDEVLLAWQGAFTALNRIGMIITERLNTEGANQDQEPPVVHRPEASRQLLSTQIIGRLGEGSLPRSLGH